MQKRESPPRRVNTSGGVSVVHRNVAGVSTYRGPAVVDLAGAADVLGVASSFVNSTASGSPSSAQGVEKAELIQLRAQVNDLLQCKEQLFAVQGDVSILKQRVKVKDDELSRAQSSIQRMIEENDEVQAGLHNKCTRYEKLGTHREKQHAEQVLDLQAEVEALKADYVRQTRSNAAMQQQLIDTQRSVLTEKSRLSSTASENRRNVDMYSSQIDALKQEVGDAGGLQKKYEEKCRSLETALQAESKENAKAAEENAQLKQQTQQHMGLIEELRFSLQTLKDQYVSARGDAEQVPRLKNELSEHIRLQTDYEHLKSAHKSLVTLYDSERNRNDTISEELKSLQKNFDDLHKRYTEVTATLTTATACADDEKQEMTAAVHTLREELHAERQRHTQLLYDNTSQQQQRQQELIDALQAEVAAEVEGIRSLLLALSEKRSVDFASLLPAADSSPGISLHEAPSARLALPSSVRLLLRDLRRLLAGFCDDYQRKAHQSTASRERELSEAAQQSTRLDDLTKRNRDLTDAVSTAQTRVALVQRELADKKTAVQRQVDALHMSLCKAASLQSSAAQQSPHVVEFTKIFSAAQAVPGEGVTPLTLEGLHILISDFVTASVQHCDRQQFKIDSLTARLEETQEQLACSRKESIAYIASQQEHAVSAATKVSEEVERRTAYQTEKLRTELAEQKLKMEGLQQLLSQARLELSDLTIELRSRERELSHERQAVKDKSDSMASLTRRLDQQRSDIMNMSEESHFFREKTTEAESLSQRAADTLRLLGRFCVPLMLRCDELVFQKSILKREGAALSAALATHEAHANAKSSRDPDIGAPLPRPLANFLTKRKLRAALLAVLGANRLHRCGTVRRVKAGSHLLAEAGDTAEVTLASLLSVPSSDPIPILLASLAGPRAHMLLQRSVAGIYAAFFPQQGHAGAHASLVSRVVRYGVRPPDVRPASVVFRSLTEQQGSAALREDSAFSSLAATLPSGAQERHSKPHCTDTSLILRTLLELDSLEQDARSRRGTDEAKLLHARVAKAEEREQQLRRAVEEARAAQEGMVSREEHSRIATKLRTAERTLEVVQQSRERVGTQTPVKTSSSLSRPLTPPSREGLSEPVFTMIDSGYEGSGGSAKRESGRVSPMRSRSPTARVSRRVHVNEVSSARSSRSATPLNATLGAQSGDSSAAQLDVLRFISRLDERVSQTLKLSKMLDGTATSTPNNSHLSHSSLRQPPPAIMTEPPSPILR